MKWPRGAAGILPWSNATADIICEASGDRFGGAVACGDVNNDGYADAVVGAPKADPGGLTNGGAVYVFYGPISGSLTASSADVILESSVAGDLVGAAVAVADFDGDDFADIAVGAPLNDAAGASAGGVYLVDGATVGSGKLSATPDFAGSVGESLGWTLAIAGDVDASGGLDLLAGSLFDGSACVAYVLLAAGFAASGPIAAKSTTLLGAALCDRTGDALAGIGSWNGDLYDDIAIGAPGHDGATGTYSGRVYVLQGGAGFVAGASYALDAVAGNLEGKQANDWAGSSLAGVGDLIGSAREDLLVGVPYGDPCGYACLVKGQPLTSLVRDGDDRLPGEIEDADESRMRAPPDDVCRRDDELRAHRTRARRLGGGVRGSRCSDFAGENGRKTGNGPDPCGHVRNGKQRGGWRCAQRKAAARSDVDARLGDDRHGGDGGAIHGLDGNPSHDSIVRRLPDAGELGSGPGARKRTLSTSRLDGLLHLYG